MKNGKYINTLVIVIALMSAISAGCGVFSRGGPGSFEFESIRGQTVQIFGRGIYRYDSVSTASQAMAQDAVTLLLGIPLLLIALYMSNRGLLKGRLLLAGTLGYFLYTYASYSFYSMYNSLFLVYVALMSASFFAFVIAILSFNANKLHGNFSQKLPVRFIGGFLIFIAAAVCLIWLGRLVPPIINGTVPAGLEHYTTMIIQALDLGFIVPTAIIAGVLIIRRRPFGYLLAPVVIIKGITMLTAITAMVIAQAAAGVKMSLAETVLFPAFNLLIIFPLVLILKNVKEKA